MWPPGTTTLDHTSSAETRPNATSKKYAVHMITDSASIEVLTSKFMPTRRQYCYAFDQPVLVDQTAHSKRFFQRPLGPRSHHATPQYSVDTTSARPALLATTVMRICTHGALSADDRRCPPNGVAAPKRTWDALTTTATINSKTPNKKRRHADCFTIYAP